MTIKIFPCKKYRFWIDTINWHRWHFRKPFNNHIQSAADLTCIKGRYGEVVLGRQYIRDEKLFAHIAKDLKAKVVLLLNNGCSHICMGCSDIDHCKRSYETELKNHSPEYLYALQSVMPFEINGGYLKTDHIGIYKISSRNADLTHLKKSLDSYINNINRKCVFDHPENYLLWSRLSGTQSTLIRLTTIRSSITIRNYTVYEKLLSSTGYQLQSKLFGLSVQKNDFAKADDLR